MSRRFDIGDEVEICMASNHIFRWISHRAIIKWIPADTGDCFQFHLLDDNGGEGDLIMINPNCSDFAGLVLKKKRDAE